MASELWRCCSLITLMCVAASLCTALRFTPHSMEGTSFAQLNVSAKQLAILRYFAQQTYLSAPPIAEDEWVGWWVDPNQDSNAALRYQLSGIAYAAAVLAANTPAYVQPYREIMRDCIRRMIDVKVWRYIDDFQDFVAQATFPDPVAYKNIMYSGHLAQALALYEDLTGDLSLSTDGWNFTWWNTTAFPKPVRYTTGKLMEAMRRQMGQYFYGAVPCEPQSIFVICNNFPHNAFHVYDKLHGTNFSAETDAVWQEAVQKYALTGAPEIGTGQFFNLVFLMFIQWWDPLASEGSDAWALGWMGTWWGNTQNSSTLFDAYRHMASSQQWSNVSCKMNEPAVCCSLVPNDIGNAIFPFPYDITTSFMPMIEAQHRRNNADQPTRRACSIALFEALGGVALDYDNDGQLDGYRYNLSAQFADWSTANLLLSFGLPSAGDGHDKSAYLKDLFSVAGAPRYKVREAKPHITWAEYPRVHVPVAFVDESSGSDILKFELLRGDGRWDRADNLTQILVAGFTPPPAADVTVMLNKAPFLGSVTWRADGVLVVLAPQIDHQERQSWIISKR